MTDQATEPAARIPVRTRRAIVYLFALGACLGVLCLLGLIHYAAQLRSAQATVSRQQQAITREQHEIAATQQAEARIRCTSIAQIVAIPVPHPVAGNPSREWENAYEQIERNRARQFGCPGKEN